MLVRLGHYLLHQSKFRYGFLMSMKFKSSKADNRMVNKLKNAQFLNKLEPNNI